jgi:hypothetical protein
MRVAALIPALCCLAGCAVATTGVVPRAEGMYTVTRQGFTAFVPLHSVTAETIKEAAAYCESTNKKYKQIHLKEISASPGRYPEAELLFRCE